MNAFELLFLLLFLSSVMLLLVTGALAISGRRSRAVKLLKWWASGVGVYFAVVLLVSLLMPRQTVAMGEELRYDDWCIAPESVGRAADGAASTYTVHLRLISRARRITQREHGVVVYLTDAKGARFDPQPDPSDIPISVALGPGDSVDISRTFSLPPGDPPTGLVIAHEGGFQMGWLMIGQGPFRQPPIVPLAGK
jgi:hypothetical protein